MEQWEYFVSVISSDSEKQKEWLRNQYPNTRFGKFAPQSLTPVLNEMGAQGWELVECHPYSFGDNQDVMTHTVTGSGSWVGNKFTNNYLCVFKRRKV